MKLSVIVPAYNEERLLASTLESIRAAAQAAFAGAGAFVRDWELIVCDNNSTDRTAEIARACGAQVVFEAHNQISRARNRGADAASGDWLLFVDADSAPDAGLFRELLAAIGSGRVLAGGSTLAADSSDGFFRWSVRAWNLLSRLMRWAAGSFIFCEAAAFRELGGFSEELYAAEELDLFSRLKRLARARGLTIAILHRHPLRTSDRKVRLYSAREMLATLGRVIVRPRRALRNAGDCHAWYDGRR